MARVDINDIDDFYDLTQGVYGYGSSSDYLTVYLNNDIDWSDHAQLIYTPITAIWYIDFYGQGHKISNLYYIGQGEFSIFQNTRGAYTNSCYFKDLILDNMLVNTTSNIRGVLCNCYGGDFRNIHISGTFTAGGYISGIVSAVGFTNAPNGPGINVYHSSVSGTLQTSSNSMIAGLAYYDLGNLSISSSLARAYGCTVKADITNGTDIITFGGIAINCCYRGKVNTPGNVYYGKNGGVFNYAVFSANSSHVGQVLVGGNIRYRNYYADNGNQGTVNPDLISATEAQLQDAAWLRDQGFSI